MKRIFRLPVIFLALVLLVTASCAAPRKCNGRRGIRVPMGIM